MKEAGSDDNENGHWITEMGYSGEPSGIHGAKLALCIHSGGGLRSCREPGRHSCYKNPAASTGKFEYFFIKGSSSTPTPWAQP